MKSEPMKSERMNSALIKSGLALMLFGCLSAQAVTEFTITADSITHETAKLSKANIKVDLRKLNQIQVDADTLDVGNNRLEQPQILVDLKANTTMLITARRLQVDQYEARKPTIFLDFRPSVTQPVININAEAKALTDTKWGVFQLACLIPKQPFKATWRCDNGLYQTERDNIPFNILFTPQANGVQAEIGVTNAKFSDASGLHAGEKLTGKITLAAQQYKQGWNWQGKFSWQKGELFWQPFYFAEGGKDFEIDGFYQAPMLQIKHALLQMPGVGTLSSSGGMNLETKAFDDVKVEARDLNFAGLYQSFIQPMVAESSLGKLKVSGKADWMFESHGTQPLKFELNIENANVEDLNGKFGFTNLNAHIPWDYNVPQTIFMGYTGGHLLKIPMGATHWQASVDRYSIISPKLTIPILDGALDFEDVSAAWINQNMVWHVQMNMQPISMGKFSQALGWPEMRGQIDGHIPLITYAGKQMNMDGAMEFNMFNGMVGMSDLRIDDPLGAVPKMYANLTMRDIDLGEITRTFNFGSISGKLAGEVSDLRLQNWKAVYMNAKIQTQDGVQSKKISQRAVENITALGGEGTAAALQRTFLRFFKEFSYEKIGIGCELRGDICKMTGVESTPTGFIIVKGKGAPTVNVNGFTQYVSWKDLLARMLRITDKNSEVQIK